MRDRQIAEAQLHSELDPGENLLWAGRPSQGVVLRKADALMIPFSLMWGGFAIFWEVSVLATGAPLFFTLWGIPFVLVGLYMIFGRFFVDARIRDRRFYGLTDRRAIVRSGLFRTKTESFPLEGMTRIGLEESRGGSGTVSLGPAASPQMAMFGGSGWPGMQGMAAPAFEMIPEAKKVYDLVRAAQRGDLAE